MELVCGVNVPECHQYQQLVRAQPSKIDCRELTLRLCVWEQLPEIDWQKMVVKRIPGIGTCHNAANGACMGSIPWRPRFRDQAVGWIVFKQWIAVQTSLIIVHIRLSPMGWDIRSKGRRERLRSLRMGLPWGVWIVLQIIPAMMRPRSSHRWKKIGRQDRSDDLSHYGVQSNIRFTSTYCLFRHYFEK